MDPANLYWEPVHKIILSLCKFVLADVCLLCVREIELISAISSHYLDGIVKYIPTSKLPTILRRLILKKKPVMQ